ncbi:tRNA-splicing endonuclease, subunit Sen54, N-terminal [Plasmopara halstedii]|uniref:tRNA-splicing endonuclease, subunit Sen54, N-terminal n=1 Tax=Plasmopara halstedii TaxID=4781 RepID=A0A0P1AUH9_PLAHL|nr:tRNA-splicing endonuclease, subunit Sen54, N-terminal [Plasmopara halstedii]CEG44694.1 tRNA-splicing endonuclease, subunit Sen54, N-terminal [Plasmopara halstedii]|eukprot:XP_024581063.1 tRNA-splicing endonuclease, subunit Sen54, N-terminal [Plasmopara halstedii]
MKRSDKDVSVGEYDPVTGLTHITHHRGRLLFNMGASFKKRQRRGLSVDNIPKALPPSTSIGTFTGLSLYPEEAYYLLQQGAIIIYIMPHDGNDAHEINLAAFTDMLSNNAHVSLSCVEVYSYLKEQKLHPRRCLEPLPQTFSGGNDPSIPRHWVSGERFNVAFEVWKTVSVNAKPSNVKPKRKQKTLVLVFRVVVCRFGDAAPTPRIIRAATRCNEALDGISMSSQVPLKLAVVHHDGSVVLFSISVPATSASELAIKYHQTIATQKVIVNAE